MRLNQLSIRQLHHQMQSMFLMANRKPINFLNLSSSIKQFWYNSETLFRYLIYNFYGLKGSIKLPSKFHNKINRIHQHGDKRLISIKTVNNQIRSTNIVRNLPKRWPYIDRLIGTHSNVPLHLKKWRRNHRSDLTNFALVTLAIQKSISDEQVQWNKLSSTLKKLFNEENKKEQLDQKSRENLFKLENFIFDRYIGKGK